jgi:bacteriorhodopsin
MDYFLATDDVVGISFWIATAVMAAGALFFWMERSTVKASWQTSLTVASLVCFVAFWHYMYMRDVWVATGESPTVYRYIDWLVTVPMQIVEFYLILAACTAVSLGVFWKLLAGSLVMLLGGYLGETGGFGVSPMLGFVVGMAGWVFIIYYIFVGEAAQIKDSAGNENLVMAFDGIKWIVTIGWAIYPIGYFLGYLGGGVDSGMLNTIYNLADLVNKFLFGLVIWHAAMRDSGVTKS